MEEVVNPLKTAFADTYSFYVKAQNYHWNVEGSMFAMYHDFFGKIYEEVGGAIDQFAEEIRAQNAYAPASFGRFKELSSIEDEVLIIKPEQMVANLFADNARVTASLQAARDVADKYNQNGLVNFIEERLDQHNKHAWMLRASMKS
jgi:starvation-inducible DNA-binding protein